MRILRAGLWLLTVLEIALAGCLLLVPGRFFALSWVNMRMPYNEHLLLDFGASNLALAVLLGAAAATLHRSLVWVALVASFVFSAGHLIIHVRYVDRLPPVESLWLLCALAVAMLVPMVLFALSRRLD